MNSTEWAKIIEEALREQQVPDEFWLRIRVLIYNFATKRLSLLTRLDAQGANETTVFEDIEPSTIAPICRLLRAIHKVPFEVHTASPGHILLARKDTREALRRKLCCMYGTSALLGDDETVGN